MTKGSIASPKLYVAKKWQLKDRRFPIVRFYIDLFGSKMSSSRPISTQKLLLRGNDLITRLIDDPTWGKPRVGEIIEKIGENRFASKYHQEVSTCEMESCIKKRFLYNTRNCP